MSMKIALDTLPCIFIVIQVLWVNTVGTVDTSISLCYSYQNCTIICEEFRSPITHISKPLNDESLALETFLET